MDACDIQVGCVILQEQRNMAEKAIEYLSRSPIFAVRRLVTSQRDCFAYYMGGGSDTPMLKNSKLTVKKDLDP